MSHNIVIRRDSDGQYVTRNLELGIVSQGGTIEQATANIKEATALFLEWENEQSINQSPGSEASLPFWWVRKSWYGKENGPDGLKSFTNRKVVLG